MHKGMRNESSGRIMYKVHPLRGFIRDDNNSRAIAYINYTPLWGFIKDDNNSRAIAYINYTPYGDLSKMTIIVEQ
jgi:hypothetical protein